MSARDDILGGATSLGIELGSTRIKACLIGSEPGEVIATGSFSWENALVDGLWSYDLDDVWKGLQAAFAALSDDAHERHGARPQQVGAIGISAMMHGYLAFDAAGEQLVPFRTWRNTNTGVAAAELSGLFGVNIPLRWTIAHLHQAVVDAEPHVPSLDFVTTLAGYVHYRLTGERVLGVGDASGVFPIDSATGTYDAAMIDAYTAVAEGRLPAAVTDILPRVLPAGAPAGALTSEGAALLDPTGGLRPGAALCPPEGDAGTGMVATNSVAPRTGNVSAGTSIFAMVVLERPLASAHHELDLVTTPAGDAVAMVHCNNGASELGAWAGLFQRFSAAAGTELTSDRVFEALLGEALVGEPDAGGLVAYNHLAGEPVAGLTDGRPVVVRTQDSELSLANFMRAQIYGVFGTLALGMQVLEGEGVAIDRMYAHGGMFRTAGVAQRFLAGAIGAPVEVGDLASEGGAWGIAVLASYLGKAGEKSLAAYLADDVFASAETVVAHPEPADVAGFSAYLDRYRAGLGVVAAAAQSL
ncbi:xylulokinase [Microbacterium halophytorum]|uniref:xylulokinase n=1 Tax=Microbacterium halophytorum TaxID=2067568 RepID=UPI000CFDB07F|nr:FGGY-family carbohydrate kinase [Microbacterium halophytorum]